MTFSGAATSFATKVERASLIIRVSDVQGLPAHWNTRDGQRPANPHVSNYRIVTPVRARIRQVIAGSYPLPDIYFAYEGGTVGQDCYVTSNSLSTGNWPGTLSGEYLYLTSPYSTLEVMPVPGDSRYRYYSSAYFYAISTENTITIGPERDIMGYKYDDPPRTISIDQAVKEIADMRTLPSGTPIP